MKLFALMCNQPQRLAAALAPVRAALVAAPPISRWGLGYIQGGDVLLVRTPKSSSVPLDLAGPLHEIATDCAIAQAVNDTRYGGTDNTPPFRFRRWLFAQTGSPELDEISPRLLEHVPEYLRRNLKGRTPAELIFHIFLAMLHDQGNIDDPNLPTQTTRRALAATLRLVATELDKIGRDKESIGLGNVAVSNGRSMIVARPATSNQQLRLRKLWLHDDRGKPEQGPEAFRGVLLVSGNGDAPASGEAARKIEREALGFEDVPANHAVLVSRDLKFSLADLEP
jgi:glutamine amidotransferase